jgi:hypothetical protein
MRQKEIKAVPSVKLTPDKSKKCYGASIFSILLFTGLLIISSSHAEVLVGKVTSIHGDVIELNLGSENGIKSGDSGRVYYTVTVAEKEKPIFIAKFKITHLSEKSSMAQVEEMTGEVHVGYLVEVIVRAGELEVRSEPSGAKIYVDGKRAGETPLVLSDIKMGRHLIRLTKEGYDSYEVLEQIGVGRKKVIANLKKTVREGELLVLTEPSGSAVYLNGRHVGTSPYEGKGLSSGKYIVRVTKEGYETWESHVTVEPGEKIEVLAKLKEIDWVQKSCGAPVWNLGDKWTYKKVTGEIFSNEVVKIAEDLFITKIDGQRHLLGYDKKTMNNIFIVEKGGKRIENRSPWVKLFDFPMFTGKKWSDATSVITSVSKIEATFSSEFQVEGIEEITTPAGTVKAFKIYVKQTLISPSRGSGWVRYWYSPAVKNWIKREVEKTPFWRGATWLQDTELISYELK